MAGDGSSRVLSPGSSGTGATGEREQIDEEYVRNVLQEVKRREQRLAKLDEERQRLDFEVAKLSSERAVQRGDAASLRVLQAFRKSLQAKGLLLDQSRSEAKRDLERALERKRQVEEDFEQLSRND